jgi:NAD(P) transhydrogenase subunit alpha
MTTASLIIAIPKETVPGEQRVALVPDVAGRLVRQGLTIRVQTGAGVAAHHPDAAYTAAGCAVVPNAAALYAGAGLVCKVQCPSPDEVAALPSGSTLISLLQPAKDTAALAALRARGIDALSMTTVPRITRAQSMDVLSSQATVAGYKAVLLGAAVMPRFMPMLVTAAGTLPPATAFVLGAGVAGLQAIATARRLGANVRAFDIRPEVKEQIESLGATFVAAEAIAKDATTSGGYAREATQEERARQAEAIAKHVAESDLVVTTAAVPGRAAPRLITGAMVEQMKPGAVIVDLAADGGGNCELTAPGETIVRHGVTILGPLNLAAQMPTHASQMYAKNVQAVLGLIVKDGALALNREDEIVKGMLVTAEGGN